MPYESLPNDVVLRNALNLYCEWLNMWQEADDAINEHRYAPDQFLVHDEGTNRYGSAALVAMIPMYDRLWIYHVHDGDEGGPTELYVWARDDNAVTHIDQGFDTMVQGIWDHDAGFIHTP